MVTEAILSRRWLRTKAAADYVGLSASTLEKLRLVPHAGPVFSRAARPLSTMLPTSTPSWPETGTSDRPEGRVNPHPKTQKPPPARGGLPHKF